MSYKCSICFKNVSEKSESIQCNTCNLWIHQPKCSGLTKAQFDVYTKPNSGSWFCQNCNNLKLPFPAEVAKPSNDVPSGSEMNDKLKALLSDLNKVVTSLTSDDDDEDELEVQFQSNSCSYLNCDEFNSIVSKTPTNFSAFHLNIASMSKHFGKLGNL